MVPGGQGFKFDLGLKYIVLGYRRGDFSLWEPSHLPQRVYSASSGELVKEIDGSFGGFLSADRMWSVRRSEHEPVDLVFEPASPSETGPDKSVGFSSTGPSSAGPVHRCYRQELPVIAAIFRSAFQRPRDATSIAPPAVPPGVAGRPPSTSVPARPQAATPVTCPAARTAPLVVTDRAASARECHMRVVPAPPASATPVGPSFLDEAIALRGGALVDEIRSGKDDGRCLRHRQGRHPKYE